MQQTCTWPYGNQRQEWEHVEQEWRSERNYDYYGSFVIESPKKWGVCHLKINRGIPNEARIPKHTYKAYRIMIKVEIKLLQLCLEITR
jgi:hypothetical protein